MPKGIKPNAQTIKEASVAAMIPEGSPLVTRIDRDALDKYCAAIKGCPVDAPKGGPDAPKKMRGVRFYVKSRQRRAKYYSSKEVNLLMDANYKALLYRMEGKSYAWINNKFGRTYNNAWAHRAVEKALFLVYQEPAQEVLQMELERLDFMLSKLWPKVVKGNREAIETALKVMVRRAKYLGLDLKAELDKGKQPSNGRSAEGTQDFTYINLMQKLSEGRLSLGAPGDPLPVPPQESETGGKVVQ